MCLPAQGHYGGGGAERGQGAGGPTSASLDGLIGEFGDKVGK